jgi:hypothetical protein
MFYRCVIEAFFGCPDLEGIKGNGDETGRRIKKYSLFVKGNRDDYGRDPKSSGSGSCQMR